MEAVREEEVKLRGGGVGFVKEVGFKPGVKERGSYRCTEWCTNVFPVCLYFVYQTDDKCAGGN